MERRRRDRRRSPRLGDDRFAVTKRRHLAHRVDREIIRGLHRSGVIQDFGSVGFADLLQHPARDAPARHRMGVKNKFLGHLFRTPSRSAPVSRGFAQSAVCGRGMTGGRRPLPLVRQEIHAHRDRRQARLQGRSHPSQRSTLNTRSAVDVDRAFRFLHTGSEWKGFPLIAANMDVTGTMAMARALGKHGALTALHKHYPNKSSPSSSPDRTARMRSIRSASPRPTQKARGGRQGGADPVHLPRCRQRLCRKIPRNR